MGIFGINFSRFKWLDQMKCQVIAFIQSIIFCQFSAGKSESRTFPLTVLA